MNAGSYHHDSFGDLFDILHLKTKLPKSSPNDLVSVEASTSMYRTNVITKKCFYNKIFLNCMQEHGEKLLKKWIHRRYTENNKILRGEWCFKVCTTDLLKKFHNEIINYQMHLQNKFIFVIIVSFCSMPIIYIDEWVIKWTNE